MINWVFVAVISVIIASIIEGIKKLPFLSKAWKKLWLRDLLIMGIAFALTIVITFITGFGLGICTTFLSAVSYVLITFFVQKAIGEEGIHKIIKKNAGI